MKMPKMIKIKDSVVYAKKIKQSENDVKKAIREYLEYNGWTVIRINNGGTHRGKDKQGKERYSFAGTPGVFDLFVAKYNQCPLWIECKATGRKPSPKQSNFMKLVNSTINGRAFWSDSFDMFLRIFNDIKNGYGLPKEV